MMLYLPLVLVTLATLLYYYFTRTFNYWKSRGVAGPEPVPFFGNIQESARRRKNNGVLMKEIYDAFPNEKVVGIYRMTTPCLLLRDLDVIKHVMIKDFDTFVDRGVEFSKEGLGANLFHADGDTWRVLRNRFTPIFTSGKLKNMMYLMAERGDSFVKYVDTICNQTSEHEIHTLVQKYTMATISACAFGVDLDVQYNTDTIATLEKVNNLIFNLTFTRELDMMYPGILKKVNKSLFPKFIASFFYGLVRDVISERNGMPTDRKDFMDLILELKQQGTVHGSKKTTDDKTMQLEINEDVIAAQAFVFFAAGYETSATTMTFLFYELAKHPEIQDKLIAHIDTVLEKHNGEVTYDTLQDMSYLEKVFDETLRKYALVDPLIRKAKEDFKVPGTNVVIKKGTQILVSPLGIHNDEKYYKDPEKFDPERHSVENSKDRHSCAYMPFGLGPRNCIGMRFAKMQSRMCVVKLLTKFRVEMSKNTPKVLEVDPMKGIISPKGGMHLNIVRR